MSIKKNIQNKDTWLRGLFILLFCVIMYVLLGLISLLTVFQFVHKIFKGSVNMHVSQFSARVINYTMQVLKYIMFQLEERPFPFKSMESMDVEGSPSAEDNEPDISEEKIGTKQQTSANAHKVD